MKSKKRGVALLSVIVMMSVVVCFSLLIYTLIISSNVANIYEKTISKKIILTNKIFDDFVDNGVIDNEYEIAVKVFSENENLKAVVAKNENSDDTNLYFLAVYDFENNKIIARQSDNFYITIKQYEGRNYYYLADVVRYKEA